MLLGNGGDDVLVGGLGDDVLVGGAGNDQLSDIAGRNLLIGGMGIDSIVAGADEDILIGGATAHDGSVLALMSLLAEWRRLDKAYLERIAHLNSTVPGGLNGATYLRAASVPSDGAVDTLLGGGLLDWFWAYMPQDSLGDLTPGERLN